MKKIYIIAGEKSGDKIGSSLIQKLKKPDVIFYGIGGELMEQEGLSSLFEMKKISIMGFWDVIKKLPSLLKLIKITIEDIIKIQPDILITIDSPGFCFRIAKKIRAKFPQMNIMHYVAPSVWAYGESRAKEFAKVYNKIFCLLPIEPEYFNKYAPVAVFVGHHAIQSLKNQSLNFFYTKYFIKHRDQVLLLTPGSRESELVHHLPIFLSTAKKIRNHIKVRVILLLSDEIYRDYINSYIKDLYEDEDITLIEPQDKYAAYQVASIAIAKSGTNVLEINSVLTPVVVGYKTNWFNWIIMQFLFKQKYVSIINIIAQKMIVPEYLQGNCVDVKLAREALHLLQNQQFAKTQIHEVNKVLNNIMLPQVEKQDAISSAAEIVNNYL